MDLWNKLMGSVLLEITAADPERFLNALTAQNVPVWDVQRRSSLVIRLRVALADEQRVCKIGEKMGAALQVLGFRGGVFRIRGWLKRPLIVAVMLFLSAAHLVLSERILFVNVVGNEKIPAGMISSM